MIRPRILAIFLILAYPLTPKAQISETEAQKAISAKKVVIGMTAEQAVEAGGQYTWLTSKGKLRRLTFNNPTQFNSKVPKPFSTEIENNIVVAIQPLIDVNECKDELKKWDKSKWPYAGFWMEDCKDGYGLRFTPTQSGMYAIKFCGPGGCMEVNKCSPLPNPPEYKVKDNKEMVIMEIDSESTYKRCKE